MFEQLKVFTYLAYFLVLYVITNEVIQALVGQSDNFLLYASTVFLLLLYWQSFTN